MRHPQRFTNDHIDQWRDQGYTIIERWFAPEEIQHGRHAIEQMLRPRWAEGAGPGSADDGFVGFNFPYDCDQVNEAALDPSLIAFARRALGDESILLANAVIGCKRGGGWEPDDVWPQLGDQPLHMDYRNNTLVVPDPQQPDQLAAIVYYTDVTIDLGPTYVVSCKDSDGWHDKNFLTPDAAPDLFAAEKAVTVPAGSVLFYTMRTFHRGSVFLAAEGVRLSHHIVYQRSDVTWGGSRSFTAMGDHPGLVRLLSRVDPDARTALGFPAPGNRYWNDQTVSSVSARYPQMDLSAYWPVPDRVDV